MQHFTINGASIDVVARGGADWRCPRMPAARSPKAQC
jgi:hypothetical protein